METHEIRPLTPQDIEAVHALEQRCFSDPWSEQLIREAFGCHGAEAAGLFVGGRLCGYYFTGAVLEEGELMNLCVDETFRRQGFARELLRHMERNMAAKGVQRIYLEVRKRNTPARSLYESEGFTVIGARPRYYGDDDAVLMVKNICFYGKIC